MLLVFRVLALASLTALPGCTRTEIVEHRFTVSAASPREERSAASACIAQCNPVFDSHGDAALVQCLSLCPGVEKLRDAHCLEAPRDTTWCYESTEAHRVFDATAGLAVAQVVGKVALVVLDAAAEEAAKPKEKKSHYKMKRIRRRKGL
jgi:hypothetical protein